MCMLFIYLNNETETNIAYRMVLISNRDEFWQRPTDCANFRGENKNWIGGIDLEPGREGGTWLGMNKQGQIAVLLNILAVQELNKRGRGSLVTEFVNNTQTSCEEYFESLHRDIPDYNPFQLVLVDLRENNPSFHCLNNVDTNVESSRTRRQQRTLAVDNSMNSFNKPWCKTQAGERKFSELLSEFGDLHSKDVLIDKLTDLLNDKTQCFPDPQLQQQFRDVGRKDEGKVIEERSALCVFSPSLQYGTRTNSVILVDQDGYCDYIERTLDTPVTVQQPSYKTVKYRFKLESHGPSNSSNSKTCGNL